MAYRPARQPRRDFPKVHANLRVNVHHPGLWLLILYSCLSFGLFCRQTPTDTILVNQICDARAVSCTVYGVNNCASRQKCIVDCLNFFFGLESYHQEKTIPVVNIKFDYVGKHKSLVANFHFGMIDVLFLFIC